MRGDGNDDLNWVSTPCPSAYSGTTTITVTSPFGWASLITMNDKDLTFHDRRIVYTTDCRRSPLDISVTRPSGVVVWKGSGGGVYAINPPEYPKGYAVVSAATAPIPGGWGTTPTRWPLTWSSPAVGPSGGDYPVEAFCPDSRLAPYTNIPCTNSSFIGEKDPKCNGEVCGTIPYSVNYNGLASMVFSVASEAKASYSPYTFLGNPGVKSTQADVPIRSWSTTSEGRGTGPKDRVTVVGVSESLAVDVRHLVYNGARQTYEVDGLVSSTGANNKRIQPVCPSESASFAKLAATLGDSVTGIVATSMETNLAPSPLHKIHCGTGTQNFID